MSPLNFFSLGFVSPHSKSWQRQQIQYWQKFGDRYQCSPNTMHKPHGRMDAPSCTDIHTDAMKHNVCSCLCLLPSAPMIWTSVLTYGALQMQTTYLLTHGTAVHKIKFFWLKNGIKLSNYKLPSSICRRFHNHYCLLWNDYKTVSYHLAAPVSTYKFIQKFFDIF